MDAGFGFGSWNNRHKYKYIHHVILYGVFIRLQFCFFLSYAPCFIWLMVLALNVFHLEEVVWVKG